MAALAAKVASESKTVSDFLFTLFSVVKGARKNTSPLHDRIHNAAFMSGNEGKSSAMVGLESLDDADVAIDGVAQGPQRLGVRGAVVRRDGLRDAVELDQHHALLYGVVVNLGGIAAREEAPAGALQRGPGELGVIGEFLLIVDGAVGRDP